MVLGTVFSRLWKVANNMVAMDRVGCKTRSRCVSKDSAIILRSKLLQLLHLTLLRIEGKKPNVTKSMYIGSKKTQHSHRVGAEHC